MTPADEISEWILHSTLEDPTGPRGQEFLLAAHSMWPQVLPYAQRHLPREWSPAEKASFAVELWEKVLRSVAKTLARTRSHAPIDNLEAYLVGIFHHRIHRFLMRERRRQRIVTFVSPEELAAHESTQMAKTEANPEREIQLGEIVACMDEWLKEVWTARMYGYSWADIGNMVSLTEQQTKMRFRYAVSKIRAQLLKGRKHA